MTHWIIAVAIAFILLVVVPMVKVHNKTPSASTSKRQAYKLGREAGAERKKLNAAYELGFKEGMES